MLISFLKVSLLNYCDDKLEYHLTNTGVRLKLFFASTEIVMEGYVSKCANFFPLTCLISNALKRCILGSYEGRQNREEMGKGKQIPNLGKGGKCMSRSPRRSPSPRQTRSPGRGSRRRSESGSPRRKQSPEQFLNLRTGTSYRSSRKSPRQNSSPRQIPSLGKESRCRDKSRSPRRRW